MTNITAIKNINLVLKKNITNRIYFKNLINFTNKEKNYFLIQEQKLIQNLVIDILVKVKEILNFKILLLQF